MTPEQRHLRAQIAANTRWSRPMGTRGRRRYRAERLLRPSWAPSRSARKARAPRTRTPRARSGPGILSEAELREVQEAPARASRIRISKTRVPLPPPSAGALAFSVQTAFG
jgi:hypothetical protein